MTNLQPLDLQIPDDAIETDEEHSSAYQTVYATASIEREANEVYNAEELSF
ncbi:MAG: hypothetical protein ACI8PW_001843 [Methylophilaceae bacterium]|jgi:hypothetical protein